MQEKMFPDWNKTPESKARFENIKKILMQPVAGRDRKCLDELRVQILEKWKALSDMFPEPLDNEDLIERLTDLGRVVHHRYVEQGKIIEDDFLTEVSTPDGKPQSEIFIILKGKVRLGFPISCAGKSGYGQFHVIHQHFRED